MIDLLIKLLPLIAPAIRYADNPGRPLWRLDLIIFTLVILVLDVLIAHLYFGTGRTEWTVSHVLERTVSYDWQHWKLAKAINKISPGHIKGVIPHG